MIELEHGKMPQLSIINALRRRWKRYVLSDLLKVGPVFDLSEGEEIVVTYTSATDKMKFFSAFILSGLVNGDAVYYTYPDKESETVRSKLKEYGIDVEEYEKSGTLRMETLTEGFMSNGKLDFEKGVIDSLNWWAWAKRKGYKHARGIEDLGDLSLFNGQWQRYIKEYWQDPRWDDPTVSEWVESKNPLGLVYVPFLKEVTAINVEHMAEIQVTELWKALSGRSVAPTRACIDLLENIGLFSRSIGLDHKQLVGRKILLEFDPASDYEKVVDNLAKEMIANVEPIFIFTSNTSPIHAYLAEQKTVKFFLTSISTSTPKSTSKNEVLLPAKSISLILDTFNGVLETYADTNVCFVFDILSELLVSMGKEKASTFLRHALEMQSSKKITTLFLLNTSAHEAEVVSQIRGLFPNHLTYDKNGLQIGKTS